MIRRLLLAYLAVTVVVLAVLEIPLGVTFARREREALVGDVRRDAEETARFAAGPLATQAPGRLPEIAAAYRQETGGRLVVVNRDGRAVADSQEPAGGDFSTRPEVSIALRGEGVSGVRTSETLGERLLVVAVPVDPGGEVIGVVRITYPFGIIEDRIRQTWLILVGVAAVTLTVVTGIGWWLARSIAEPIRAMSHAAQRLGEGELGARTPVPRGPPEVRQLAEELNDAAGRLQELRTTHDAFLADTSHQLRTPLAALQLRLENLEATDPTNTDVAAALAEVHRLSRIVDGVLHLGRAGGDPSAKPVSVDVPSVLAERAEAWEPVAAERSVVLVRNTNVDAAALAHPDHLHQALDNLIANALDASPAGGRLWLTTALEDGWVEIHVADEGPGMSAERRARASDRYTNRGEGSGGFGLGLAIASRLVALDGGRLDLLQAPTGGLDARVRLRPSQS